MIQTLLSSLEIGKDQCFRKEYINKIPQKPEFHKIGKKSHISYINLLNQHSQLLAKNTFIHAEGKNDPDIKIKNTLFNKLFSPDLGGAILIKSLQSTAILSNCIFKECFAKISGGGLYLVARYGLLQKCVLSECVCRTIYSGQAFYASLKNLNINHSTVIKCSPIVESNGYESFILLGGVQKITCFNSSFNIAKKYASGFLSAESTSLRLNKINICNNSSPNQIIALTHVRPDDKIKNLNIIGNKGTKDGLIYMSGAFIIITHASIFFNEGPFLCFTIACGPAFLVIENSHTDYLPEHIVKYRSVLKYSNNKTNFTNICTNHIQISTIQNFDHLVKGDRLLYE